MSTLTPNEIEAIAQEVAKIVIAELTKASPSTELDSSEVATLLKVSKPTIERWTRDQVIPSYLVGRCRRYNREAVLQAVQQNQHSN